MAYNGMTTVNRDRVSQPSLNNVGGAFYLQASRVIIHNGTFLANHINVELYSSITASGGSIFIEELYDAKTSLHRYEEANGVVIPLLPEKPLRGLDELPTIVSVMGSLFMSSVIAIESSNHEAVAKGFDISMSYTNVAYLQVTIQGCSFHKSFGAVTGMI
jgi:hypothetical protein